MFKEILNTIWAWFWSKTEVDEKATETVDKIKAKSALIKKELKDVVNVVKATPTKPKKKYYRVKAKAETKK
jgi:hypothetical protein